MERTITNKHDATISVQVVNDVINTKTILSEMRRNESVITSIAKLALSPAHQDQMMMLKNQQDYLAGKLNRIWAGDVYSHPIR